MEIKTFVLSVIVTALTVSPPTAGQLTQINPGQFFPPGQTCPDLMCTLEFIPENCRETPTVLINGNYCTGCPRWKSSCNRTSNNSPNSGCPVLTCPTLAASKQCQVNETYEYNGRMCNACPRVRADCAQSFSNSQQVTCPTKACPLIFIPDECKETPTFDFMGKKCDKCPKWRTGCTPASPDQTNLFQQRAPPIPRRGVETGCPIVACDSYVPSECQVKEEFQYRGKVCYSCPTWRVGCREPERQAQIANPSFGGAVPITPIDCPKFPCSSNQIPANCLELQPYEYRGKTCYRCPRWREGCRPRNTINIAQSRFPEIPCPLVRCEDLKVPSYCLQEEVYQFNNRMCQNCPTVKPECRLLVQPSRLTTNTNSQVQCPLRRCPLMYIPPECMEIETFEFEGKSCEGCPRFRPGCVPLSGQSNSPQINVSALTQQQPGLKVECPLVGCPKIHIPAECRLEQPYQFQGKTCYGCPKRKVNCSLDSAPSILTAIKNNQQTLPEPECPLMKCNRMYIPPECREVESFDVQGRTCYMCPKFKQGCIPGETQEGSTVTNKLSNLVSTKKMTRPLDTLTSSQPEVACPLMNCSKSNLAAECFESQQYEFMGKTCYKCPLLRSNCSEIQAATKPATKPATAAPSIANLNGVIPVGRVMSAVQGVLCPRLPCPKIAIPPECREERSYMYNGVRCPGCPTWRQNCRSENQGRRPNMNMNGILAYSLFNEMMLRR